MPPLIRRSQSAVPRHAGEDGGRSDAHPLPPRELDALRGDPDEVRARLSEHIPLRGYGEPEEFGWAAAFVLSPAASRITGAMIPVDGDAISSI
jgi:NAD(P)-dependent dehydrogenase (short-subunit alcohol dehydrogenase family)